MGFDYSLTFATLTTEEKRIYLSQFNEEQLDELLEHKYLTATRWVNYRDKLDVDIMNKNKDIAEAYKYNDNRRAEKLTADLDDLKLERAKAQKVCEINHLEACCCFITYCERHNLTEDKISKDHKDCFPLRNWKDIEGFLQRNNNYQEVPELGKF